MLKHSSLSTRLSLVLVGILLFTTVLTVAGGVWKLRSLLLTQERDVYSLVLNDIVAKLENDIQGDYNLRASKNAQGIVDRHINQIAPIKRISIIDLQGRVIFDTSHTLIGTQIPADWLKESVQAGDRVWVPNFQKLRAADAPVRDAAGKPVGFVLLLTQDVRQEDVSIKLFQSLSLSSLAALAAAVVMCIFLSLWFCAWLNKMVRPIKEDLSHLAYSPYRDALATTTDFSRSVAAQLSDMAWAQQEIRQILGKQ